MGACSDHRRKRPAAVAGVRSCWLCQILLVVSAPVVAYVPCGVAAVAGVPVGACLRFTRCRVWCFFLLYGKNSNRAAAGVRFLLKKRTKKIKHENV